MKIVKGAFMYDVRCFGGIFDLPIYLMLYYISKPITPPNSEIICGQNVGTKVVCGMILFFEKKAMLKI